MARVLVETIIPPRGSDWFFEMVQRARAESVTVQEVIANLTARADYGRSEGERGGIEAWLAVGEIIIAVSEITGQPIEDIRKVFSAG